MTAVRIPFELSGVRQHELPHISLAAEYDFLDHPFPVGRRVLGDLYSIPDYPDLLLRRHALSAQDFPNETTVFNLLDTGLEHFGILAETGVHIPSHRHTEVRLPDVRTEREGHVFSILPHLGGLARLHSEAEAHIPATLHILESLGLYTAHILDRKLSDMLWDIYRPDQYSLREQTERDFTSQPWIDYPQGVFLHDFGLNLASIKAGGGAFSQLFELSLGRLTNLTVRARHTARGTNNEEKATKILNFVQRELPTLR